MSDLTLERWNSLSNLDRESVCKRIEQELPSGFLFRELRKYSTPAICQDVGLFEFQGRMFSLVPGGEVKLGFDLEGEWMPTQEELENFDENDWGMNIYEYLEAFTLRPRRVWIPPLLVEMLASLVGWKPLCSEDPRVKEVVHQLSSHATTITKSIDGQLIRVEVDERNNIFASIAFSWTHSEVVTSLGSRGFRLPASDEWEYLCSAGTPSLFRWGDHVPCEKTPSETPLIPAERTWRKEMFSSGGAIEYPASGFDDKWNWARRPNAFGIYFTSDEYQRELMREPGIVRGSDGGYRACGGHDAFSQWSTLASSYFEEIVCKYDPEKSFGAGSRGIEMRRVLELN